LLITGPIGALLWGLVYWAVGRKYSISETVTAPGLFVLKGASLSMCSTYPKKCLLGSLSKVGLKCLGATLATWPINKVRTPGDNCEPTQKEGWDQERHLPPIP
jgi:hypothetical protein